MTAVRPDVGLVEGMRTVAARFPSLELEPTALPSDAARIDAICRVELPDCFG